MKVNLHFKENGVTKQYHQMFIEFVKFLQNKLPLKNNVDIYFLANREVEMSTGSRHSGGKIYVLSANRLNRDILRTIAHEWTHEFQMTILGRERGPSIGGKNEDEANAYAGSLVKLFEKDFPDYNEMVYE